MVDEWLPDLGQFVAGDILGNITGLPGSRWADVRTANVRRIIYQVIVDTFTVTSLLLFTAWNIGQYVRPPHFRDSAQGLVPHTPAQTSC
jgi:hypothetical protein